MLVYDITDIESFSKVRKWVRELRKIVGNDITIAIAGNKIDLEKSRAVSEEDAVKYIGNIFLPFLESMLTLLFRYADSVGASHFYTSAKTNQGVDDVFADITTSKYGKCSETMGTINLFVIFRNA